MSLHKSQIFFYLLLSFVLGVALVSFLNVPKIIWLVALNVSFVFIILFWPMRTRSRFARLKIRKWKYVFYVFLIIFFIFGGLRMQSVTSDKSILRILAGTEKGFPAVLGGYIDSEVEDLGNRQRFTFRVKEIEVPNAKASNIDEKILVTAPQYPEYFYGDTLEIGGTVKLPKNSEDFNYVTFLAKDGIYTIIGFPEIKNYEFSLKFTEQIKVSVFKNIFTVKKSFQNSIQKVIVEPNAAFINGILLGTRESIPQDLKDDFAKTSITHVLAISGYNITILAAVVSWLFLLFFKRRAAFWWSVVAIVLFTILTGASASVVRASIMGLLILLANNSGRLYDSKNALILAAAAMIWFNPMSLRFDVGFQLSFLATVGILFVAPLFEPYVKKLPNLLNFRETFLMTTSAQIMVLPLILFYFNNFSLVALPANLIVLPFIPYAMLFGFLTGIGGMIWSYLGLAIGSLAWLVTSFEILVVRFFASVPYTSFKISVPWYGVVIIYGAIIYLLKRIKKQQKLF